MSIQSMITTTKSVDDSGEKVKPRSEVPWDRTGVPITERKRSLDDRDYVTIIDAEYRKNGPAGHHLRGYNSFVKFGLSKIITSLFRIERSIVNERKATEEDRSISAIQYKVEFSNLNIKPPSHINNAGLVVPTFPYTAELNDQGYYASVFVTVKASATAIGLGDSGQIKTIEETVPDIHVTDIPVMYGSDLCITKGQPASTLMDMHEDPAGVPGYFILGGKWFINTLENLPSDKPQFYLVNNGAELSRGILISKPGDDFENSTQIQIQHLNNGQINIELTTDKFSEKQIPWFLFMRMLGVSSDKEMFDMVTFGGDDNPTAIIEDMLSTSMTAYDSHFTYLVGLTSVQELIYRMAIFIDPDLKYETVKSSENMQRELVNKMNRILDQHVLPHIGLTPNDRIKKARYLGDLVRRLCLVDSRQIEPSKRDSTDNKRYHDAGICLSKTTKSIFNKTTIQAFQRALTDAFKGTTFSEVDLAGVIRNSFSAAKFLSTLKKVINTGDDEVKIDDKTSIISHMSTQLFHAKSHLNLISIARTIAISSNTAIRQKERADEMRRVGPDFVGYIDPIQSADSGSKVGTEKQLASSASLTGISSSQSVKDYVYADPAFIALSQLPSSEIYKKTNDPAFELGRVIVNGDWIGFVKQAGDFMRRFRASRRLGNRGINREVSINLNSLSFVRDVEIWCDFGRLIRPLMIVYSNVNEAYQSIVSGGERIPFKQWINVTADHIAKLRSNELTIDDLVEEGVLEYITSQESTDCLIAPSPSELEAQSGNPLLQYSHCDIPQAMVGWVTASVPMANHSNSVRDTMAGNHRRQACAWFALNWPWRIENQTFLQYHCERGLSSTMTSRVTHPNGHNCLVAMAVHSSKNEEDSIIFKKDAVDRGMFRGCAFDFAHTTFNRDDRAGVINNQITMDIKKGSKFDKTVNGLIKLGSYVEKNDVLICKTSPAENPNGAFTRVDRSVVYTSDEPAYAWQVHGELINDKSEKLAKVALRKPRPLHDGDKLSSCTGNKGIASHEAYQVTMMYNAEGISPDLVVNPHSIPSRMAVNQIMEAASNFANCKKGIIADATVFYPQSIDDMIEDMKQFYGLEFLGTEQMYCGETSLPMQGLVFNGFNVYQRLLKFVLDDNYAVDRGATIPMTGQPKHGKHVEGGLRMSEMESDNQKGAQGAIRANDEKTRAHSDGINMFVCRRCGYRATANLNTGMLRCRHCNEDADIYIIESTKISNLLWDELSGMGISIKYNLKDYEFI
jgi:DNA-directed RNA polymerase subunit B